MQVEAVGRRLGAEGSSMLPLSCTHSRGSRYLMGGWQQGTGVRAGKLARERASRLPHSGQGRVVLVRHRYFGKEQEGNVVPHTANPTYALHEPPALRSDPAAVAPCRSLKTITPAPLWPIT